MDVADERFGDGLSVLIVEDEETVCILLTEVLKPLGFAVTSVSNVAAAISAMDARPFDLYLLDKNLSDGTGLDVARRVRESQADSAMIMMTGFANVESASEAMRLGFGDYIEKPFPSLEVTPVDLLPRLVDLPCCGEQFPGVAQRVPHGRPGTGGGNPVPGTCGAGGRLGTGNRAVPRNRNRGTGRTTAGARNRGTGGPSGTGCASRRNRRGARGEQEHAGRSLFHCDALAQ